MLFHALLICVHVFHAFLTLLHVRHASPIWQHVLHALPHPSQFLFCFSGLQSVLPVMPLNFYSGILTSSQPYGRLFISHIKPHMGGSWTLRNPDFLCLIVSPGFWLPSGLNLPRCLITRGRWPLPKSFPPYLLSFLSISAWDVGLFCLKVSLGFQYIGSLLTFTLVCPGTLASLPKSFPPYLLSFLSISAWDVGLFCLRVALGFQYIGSLLTFTLVCPGTLASLPRSFPPYLSSLIGNSGWDVGLAFQHGCSRLPFLLLF